MWHSGAKIQALPVPAEPALSEMLRGRCCGGAGPPTRATRRSPEHGPGSAGLDALLSEHFQTDPFMDIMQRDDAGVIETALKDLSFGRKLKQLRSLAPIRSSPSPPE